MAAANKKNKTNQQPENKREVTIIPKNLLHYFDENENVLNGNVFQVKQWYYKAKTNYKGMMKCIYDSHSAYVKDFLFTFSPEGQCLEMIQNHFRDGYYKYVLDDKGDKVIAEHRNPSGILLNTNKYKYNKSHKMTEVETAYADGKPTNFSLWIYDEKGKVIEYKSGSDGKVTDYQTFVNDEYGNKIEQKIYKEDKLERWMVYKNNEYGHATETKELNPDGSIIKTETKNYTYDENGKLIGINNKIFKQREEAETWKYEYDEKNNWIKKIMFYKNMPVGMYVREFNYFDSLLPEPLKNEPIPIKTFFVLEGNANTTKDEFEEYDDDDDEIYENSNDTSEPEKYSAFNLNPQQSEWVAEGSRPDNFNAHRFYVAAFNQLPVQVSFNNIDVEVRVLLKKLKEEMNAVIINAGEENNLYIASQPFKRSYTLGFPNRNYILQLSNINEELKSNFRVPKSFDYYIEPFSSYLQTGNMVLFRPPDYSNKRSRKFEDELNYYLEYCSLEETPEMPEIYMIQVENNNFTLKSHPVNDNFIISNLDIHYGYGFAKFHDELMMRFQKENKGLVLFHGEPGTGKTFYIRHLLRKMASGNKKVIYMPPNMVDHLVDPVFMTFISRKVAEYSNGGNFCVLLIEDAEPLLAQRQSETRIQGITNLLNMTDGLLNDMLNLQIICTFNVPLRKLDKALLRPGRLIARKEFKELSVLDANILGQQLGIKHHFTKPVNLSEVYSFVKNKNTLIHDVDENGQSLEE